MKHEKCASFFGKKKNKNKNKTRKKKFLNLRPSVLSWIPRLFHIFKIYLILIDILFCLPTGSEIRSNGRDTTWEFLPV